MYDRLAETAMPKTATYNGGANEAMYAATPSVTAARSEVADALAGQEKALAMLHQCLESLEAKAEPVLMPVGPTNNKDGVGRGVSSRVAQCITSNTDRIGDAIVRVQSITDRLAV